MTTHFLILSLLMQGDICPLPHTSSWRGTSLLYDQLHT